MDKELEATEFHYLSNTLREDAEEHSGVVFCPLQDGRVQVWTHFGSTPYDLENAAYSLKTMTVEDARAHWRELLDKTYGGFSRYAHRFNVQGVFHPWAQI